MPARRGALVSAALVALAAGARVQADISATLSARGDAILLAEDEDAHSSESPRLGRWLANFCNFWQNYANLIIESKFVEFLLNFERLVLGCIETDCCNQILMLLHFSGSTRLPHLCTF